MVDGNLWMLDNLAINLISTSLADLKGNTNASDAALEALKGVNTRDKNNDPYGKYAVEEVSIWPSDKSGWEEPLIVIDNEDTIGSFSGKGRGRLGIEYNYCAASAGAYCYNNDTHDYPETITEDICPSGWKIPTGNSYGEFRTLYTLITGYTSTYNDSYAVTLSYLLLVFISS